MDRGENRTGRTAALHLRTVRCAAAGESVTDKVEFRQFSGGFIYIIHMKSTYARVSSRGA
jgi:hypothetical protein